MNKVAVMAREFKFWGKAATRRVKAGTRKYGVFCGVGSGGSWVNRDDPDKVMG